MESRAEPGAGPAIRILLSKGSRGRDDYDLTRAFTAAVAHALWTVRAGDDAQNWIDAEHLLEHLFGASSTRPERRPAAREESVTGPLPDADVLSRFRSRGAVTKA